MEYLCGQAPASYKSEMEAHLLTREVGLLSSETPCTHLYSVRPRQEEIERDGEKETDSSFLLPDKRIASPHSGSPLVRHNEILLIEAAYLALICPC